jgi:hypothetical protein
MILGKREDTEIEKGSTNRPLWKKYRSDGRGGRRGKQLLDHLKETRGYWKLKE